MSYPVNAFEEHYESAQVFGIPMVFTSLRVDRRSVPDGVYLYEVRHSDEDWGEPIEVCKWVMVNHLGTLLSSKPLTDMVRSEYTGNYHREIDTEDDFCLTGDSLTLKEYLERNPVEKNHEERER